MAEEQEQVKRFVLGEPEVDTLKGRWGKVWIVESDDGDQVAFRSPSPQEFKRYRESLLNDSRRVHAAPELIADVLLAPAFKSVEYKELFERLPAFITTIEREVLRVSGYNEGTRARKA